MLRLLRSLRLLRLTLTAASLKFKSDDLILSLSGLVGKGGKGEKENRIGGADNRKS